MLPNTPRSKSNRTMKFGQNIIRQTFLLKNHTQNLVEKLFPDLFLKNQNWAYSWINSLKFYIVYFCCMLSWEIWKLSCGPLAFISKKAFLKNKKYFLHYFWRKIFTSLYSVSWPDFIVFTLLYILQLFVIQFVTS